MRRLAAVAALVAAGFGTPERASAQDAEEVPVVQSVAVLHFLDAVADGPRPLRAVQVDRRVLSTHEDPAGAGPIYRLAAARDSTAQARLERLVGGTSGDFEHATLCTTSSPRSCRLRNGSPVVAVSQPRRTDGGVEVVVEARWATDLERLPVARGRYAFLLEPSGEGWRVRSVRTLFVT